MREVSPHHRREAKADTERERGPRSDQGGAGCCSHRLRREGQRLLELKYQRRLSSERGVCLCMGLILALDFDLENREEKYLYYAVLGGAWLWQPQKTDRSTVVGGAL